MLQWTVLNALQVEMAGDLWHLPAPPILRKSIEKGIFRVKHLGCWLDENDATSVRLGPYCTASDTIAIGQHLLSTLQLFRIHLYWGSLLI